MCVLQIAILICSSSHAQSNFQDNTSIDQGVNLERKSVENLAEDLCSVLINTNLDHQINIKDEMESILLAFKQIQDSDSNKSEKLASFWNTHNHKMTCKESGSSEKTQHIFKKSLHMKLHKPTLFDYFLHKENGFAVDVNYIGTSLNNGSNETLLDLVRKILETPELLNKYNEGQLKRLEALIVRRFNGRSAK